MEFTTKEIVEGIVIVLGFGSSWWDLRGRVREVKKDVTAVGSEVGEMKRGLKADRETLIQLVTQHNLNHKADLGIPRNGP